MDLLKAMSECITGRAKHAVKTNEKDKPITDHKQSTEEMSSTIISILFSAEKPGYDLECRLQDIVRSCGWYESLAKRILDGLVTALNSGAAMGRAMRRHATKRPL